MTAGEFLAAATKQLQAGDIGTARLDVLVLLEDALNTNRAQILANPDLLITASQQKLLSSQVARRAKHEPLAYIRQRTEFYGRTFYVDARVLEPRPESETMIELLKRLDLGKQPTVIDTGTGSGALAITAKLELPNAEVHAVDIERDCLDVARKNSIQLAASITLQQSDLITTVPDSVLEGSILLCNLPYVPDNFQINTAATHEPRLAIFGGGDGLNLYRRLFKQLVSRKQRPAYILSESLPPQHDVLKIVAGQAGFVLDTSEDFIQVFKTAAGSFAL